MQTRLPLAIALACAASSVPARAQSTWYVDVNATPPGAGTQQSPYTSIQFAIDRPTTLAGDTLLVAPGTYVENIDLATKRLRIESVAGPLSTTVRAASAGVVVANDLLSTSVPPSEFIGFTVSGVSGIHTNGILADWMIVRRCIVRGHDATSQSTGVRTFVHAWIEQCTIVGNSFGILPGVFGGDITLDSSIVYGNTFGDLAGNTEQIEADYCAWNWPNEHATLGAGNLDVDPRFWDAAGLDFHLAPGSPCIDAGDPSAPLDPDGSRRDIGALTYDASYAPPPTVYCTSKTNSLGCAPSIGAVGSASASGAPFTITCVQELSHKVGLLFYGFAPMGAAYQGGYLCVQSPVRRTSLLDSGGNIGVDDCSGAYVYDFDARIQSGADPSLGAGTIVYAQFWSRDPASSFTSVRSDALSFGIAP